MKILFTTHNNHKLEEVKSLLPDNFELSSLVDINFTDDIIEHGSTIEENAHIKSQFIYDQLGLDNFSDDSGLEVEALQQAPGVYSARYAGNQKNDLDNINLLLKNLEGIQNRNARFKTVISLCIKGKYTQFTGIVNGTIAQKPLGSQGFGYDPIFIPNHSNRTFAEMNRSEKSALSHRSIALNQLVEYLNQSI